MDLASRRCYSFAETIDIATGSTFGSDNVPIIVFLHVPKAGGRMFEHILQRNVAAFHILDHSDPMHCNLSWEAPRSPIAFAGHIGLKNDIFRSIPGRYFTVTLLRDPVSRMISNFHFTYRSPDAPWHEDVRTGQMDIVDLAATYTATVGSQWSYFSDGPADLESCLANLESAVSLFGFTELYDEFLVLASALLGLPDVLYFRKIHETAALAPPPGLDPATLSRLRSAPSASQRAELDRILVDDREFYARAVQIYARRMKLLSDRIKDPGALDKALARFRSACSQYKDFVAQQGLFAGASSELHRRFLFHEVTSRTM